MNSPLALSVVIVTHGMDRELPRTLESLSVPYQRDIDPDAYELIVIDNGSTLPVHPPTTSMAGPTTTVHRIEDASASPAHAANVGIGRARGDLIGLIIDGARMASPGLLALSLRASLIAARSIVTAPAWHLGPSLQVHSSASGYDQSHEDRLLSSAGWQDDGYNLFAIATPAASSGRGLFGAMGESSSLFMSRSLWTELGGLDERFALPGGGLVNHDLYRRACGLPDARLVVMLGEGTFHQIHGGAATSGRVTRAEMRADYEAICGVAHQPPSVDPLYVGSIPRQYLAYVADSVELAQEARRSRAGVATSAQPESGTS